MQAGASVPSKRSNQHQPMNTLLNLLAAYVAAGSFGVAFVMTALEQPLPQHSGTQSFVRVVR